jgi:hypothetical protein
VQIRHCVEESNVDEKGTVIDPTKATHVTINSGRIEEMSGLVDVKTHLNLDYPDHKITTCVIAEKLEKGAKVRFGERGLAFATVSRAAYGRFGPVDFTRRYFDLVEAVKEYHEASKEVAAP